MVVIERRCGHQGASGRARPRVICTGSEGCAAGSAPIVIASVSGSTTSIETCRTLGEILLRHLLPLPFGRSQGGSSLNHRPFPNATEGVIQEVFCDSGLSLMLRRNITVVQLESCALQRKTPGKCDRPPRIW